MNKKENRSEPVEPAEKLEGIEIIPKTNIARDSRDEKQDTGIPGEIPRHGAYRG